MLDGLELADGLAELLALLGIGHGQLPGARCQAHLEGRAQEHRPVGPAVTAANLVALGHLGHSAHRGQRVHRLGRLERQLRGVHPPHTVAVEHQQGIEHVGVLDQRGTVGALDEADHGIVCHPRGQQSSHQRSGHQGPAELLEHQPGLSPTQADPAVFLGHYQREHAGVGQLAPQLAIHSAAVGQAPHGVDVEASLAQIPDAIAQRYLIIG